MKILKYKYILCLRHSEYLLGKYCLRVVQYKDMDSIRVWRNQQIRVLRQMVKLTKTDQKKYFKETIKPTYKQKTPKLILFSLFLKDKHIAYGGLTNIDWKSKRAELSFLESTQRSECGVCYKRDFSAFLDIIARLSFQELKLHKIYTETYNIRPKHIRILEAHGFRREGLMKDHVIINGTYVDSLIHGLINK